MIRQFDVRQMRVREYLDKVLLNLRESLDSTNLRQVYELMTTYV